MTPSIDFSELIFKGLSSLILVLGLVLVTIAVLRRFVFRQGPRAALNRLISIVDAVNITPKKGVVLVRVADQYLVLGYSETGVTLLSEVKDSTGIEGFMERQPSSVLSSIPTSFSQILERVKS